MDKIRTLVANALDYLSQNAEGYEVEYDGYKWGLGGVTSNLDVIEIKLYRYDDHSEHEATLRFNITYPNY